MKEWMRSLLDYRLGAAPTMWGTEILCVLRNSMAYSLACCFPLLFSHVRFFLSYIFHKYTVPRKGLPISRIDFMLVWDLVQA